MNKPYFKNQSGQVLVFALIALVLIVVNTLLIISGAFLYRENTNYSVQSVDATNLAEAGIDKAVASLNTSAGSYNGETDTALGNGTFSVTIVPKDATTEIVQSTGYVPNRSNPVSHKTVTIQVSKGTGVSFNYALQSGAGGITMSNGSVINGSVYSNGNISMSNNAVISGDAYVAGGTQPTSDQQSDCTNPNCTDYIFGKNVSGQNVLDVAESFKLSTSSVLNKISLKLEKFGSPANQTIRLLADNGGKPNKNSVIASGTLYASLVSSSYGWVDVYFSTPPSLSANTPYWIMIAIPSADSTNYWAWSEDTSRSYTNGSAEWSTNWQAGSPVWTAISGNLGFQAYTGGVPTSIIGTNGVSIGGNAHANTLQDLSVGKDAYYQTQSGVTASGSSCTGISTHCHPGSSDPVAQNMAISDANIEDWQNQAASFGTFTGDITTCPSTLAAGKYVGSITLPNNCTVIVSTPIWVTGNLNLTNSDILKLSNAVGGSSGVFVVDNFITLGNGNQTLGNGSSGSYLFLISNFDSQDDSLHRDAIDLNNSGNSGIVYSNLGTINIYNNNDMSVISGYKLILGNGVTVNYSNGLASSFVSSGPSGSFSAIKGTYQIK